RPEPGDRAEVFPGRKSGRETAGLAAQPAATESDGARSDRRGRRRAAEWSERGHALSSLCDPEPAGYSVRHPAGSVAASGRDTLANDSARDLGIQSGANDLERLTGE